MKINKLVQAFGQPSTKATTELLDPILVQRAETAYSHAGTVVLKKNMSKQERRDAFDAVVKKQKIIAK